MSQVALADKADIPLGTLTGLEQGRRLPAWPTLQRLTKAMGASLGDFDICELSEEKKQTEPAAASVVPVQRGRPTREFTNDETVEIKTVVMKPPAKGKKKGK